MPYNKEKVDEMTLALLYLGMSPIGDGGRAWKAFDRQTMLRLAEKGWVTDPSRVSPTVEVTAEGRKRSEALFHKHFQN